MFWKKNKSVDFSALDPILSCEENRIYLVDGRVAVGFKVGCMEIESGRSDDYHQLKSFLATNASKMDAGTIIQKIDVYFHTDYESDVKDMDFFESKITKNFWGRKMLEHESYIYIIAGGKGIGRPNSVKNYFTTNIVTLKNPLNGIEERAKRVEKDAEDFTSSISSLSNVSFTRMNDQDNENLLKQMYNLEFSDIPTGYQSQMENKGYSFSVGSKNVNVVSLSGQGEQVYTNVMNDTGLTYEFIQPLTFGLKFPHIVVQSLLLEDNNKELVPIDVEKKILQGGIGLAKESQQIRADALEEFTKYVRVNNKRLATLNLHVLIPSTSNMGREKKIRQTLNAFDSMFHCEAMVESFDNAPFFFGCLPGNAGQLYRGLLIPVDNAICYFNFTSNYPKMKGDILVTDRFRNPYLLNFKNYNLVNTNAFIVGSSGSGKSFQVCYKLSCLYNVGNRVVIIDKDGSYKRFILANKGKYVELTDDNPLTFNPFFLLPEKSGEFILPDDKRIFLISIIKAIYDKEIDNVSETILEKLLHEYYAQEKDLPLYDRFYQFISNKHIELKNDEDWQIKLKYLDMDGFLIALSRYSKSGTYPDLLNDNNPLDISDHRLICFDMAGIVENENLYRIVSLMLTELTLDIFRKFPEDETNFVIDEAWSMLDGLQTFIDNMYRTVRKKNGSIWTITQGLEELEKSPISGSLLTNSEIKMFFKPSQANVLEDIIKYFKFDEHQSAKLRSLTGSKSHREFAVQLGSDVHIFAVEAPREVHAILTSKPTERNHYFKLLDQYVGNYELAAEMWANDKKQDNI